VRGRDKAALRINGGGEGEGKVGAEGMRLGSAMVSFRWQVKTNGCMDTRHRGARAAASLCHRKPWLDRLCTTGNGGFGPAREEKQG
jgi:hypothetical protein